MAASLLERIGISPAAAAQLPPLLFRELLAFLVRWEATADGTIILAAAAPRVREVADLAVQLALAVGQQEQARQLLAKEGSQLSTEQRWRAQALLERAAGDIAVARRTAQRLPTAGDRAAAFLVVDLAAAMGDRAGAEAELRRREVDPALAPGCQLRRAELAWPEQARSLHFATDALAAGEQPGALTPADWVRLRTLLTRLGDNAGVDVVQRRLINLLEMECTALQAALRSASVRPAVTAARPAAGATHEPARSPDAQRPLRSNGAQIVVTRSEQERLRDGARDLFGYADLLPAQAEIMSCALRKENVLAVLPTGAGKSLCYQLPAFLEPGLTLVVSPLIALMKDQMERIPPALHGQAAALSSALDGGEWRQTLQRLNAGLYRLLYVSPERLRQPAFVQTLRNVGVSRLVVDEAHCVSEWGHDFRPDYLRLAHVHRLLGKPPLLAMTATAPPRVREDIRFQLLGDGGVMRTIVGDTFRPNLQIGVLRANDLDEKNQRLLALAQATAGAGILYVRSRKRCEELAAYLMAGGVEAAAYHAGIDNRSEIQERFMRGDVRVMAATVAFGMGVDKPDIRFVLHDGPADSLESYYQEIGRAGRDGQPSLCVLVYTESDVAQLERRTGQGNVTAEMAGAVLRRLAAQIKPGESGLLAPASLTGDGADETAVRVALSLLEKAGLAVRHDDTPEMVTLVRPRHIEPGSELPALTALWARLKLAPGEPVTGTFAGLSRLVSVPVIELEQRLLLWQAEQRLRFYGSGKLLAVTVTANQSDAVQRIERQVELRLAEARRRATAVITFLRTGRCRHGQLGSYLGSDERRRCNVCDNCGVRVPTAPAPGALDEAVPIVLGAVAEQSWGKRTLMRLLTGDREAGAKAQQSDFFGALRRKSEGALYGLIDGLLADGLLEAETLDHGGVTLRLSRRGKRTLQQHRSES